MRYLILLVTLVLVVWLTIWSVIQFTDQASDMTGDPDIDTPNEVVNYAKISNVKLCQSMCQRTFLDKELENCLTTCVATSTNSSN